VKRSAIVQRRDTEIFSHFVKKLGHQLVVTMKIWRGIANPCFLLKRLQCKKNRLRSHKIQFITREGKSPLSIGRALSSNYPAQTNSKILLMLKFFFA